MRVPVFVPEPFPAEVCALIEDIAEVRLGRFGRAYSEDELAAAITDVHALVITSRDRITARAIESAPSLRVITKAGARPVNVDLAAARARNVTVTWTPGANAASVAEHSLALMLALSKRLFQAADRLRRGGWRDLTIVGTELSGKTVGLIGLGAVGAEVRRKLLGFDVSVLGFDPFVPRAMFDRLGVEPVRLDSLLAEADVVSVHCELTEGTRHMLGERELSLMKPSALLVNTARGAVVDEQALYRALSDGRIAGAGLDVFELEPPDPGSPLLTLDNVIATPHSAALTREAMARETRWAIEDVRAILLRGVPVHFRGE